MSISIVLPIPLYLSMMGYYHLLAPRFRTEKQRAYILSTLSSALMSCIAIPFTWIYAHEGLEGLYVRGAEGRMGRLGEIGVVLFGVYLFGEPISVAVCAEHAR